MTPYPAYVWLLVVVGAVGFPALTALGLYRAIAGSASRRAAIGVAGVFAVAWSVWLVTSAVLADRGAYTSANPAGLPLAAGVALIAALVASTIPPIRTALATPAGLSGLTWPHVFRVVGVVFLVALALGRLPAVFALPAGLGDIAIGLAAPTIARRLARGDRSGAIWFNILGLADLVVAVTLGLLAGLGPVPILAVSPSTVDLAQLPLALIPTTAVPLAMALHLVSLAKLRRAPAIATQPAAAMR